MKLIGIANKIRTRQISAKELTLQCLDCISRERNNAFLRTMPERAIKKAIEIDEALSHGKECGPLAGVPVAIKDNMCLEGEEVSAGSKILQGFISPYTATPVKKLEEAGANIIGFTNMDEFAMGSSTENSAFGATLNPINPEYVPGGSSGGSAAALAADLIFSSLGTDTGGSIRLPASFCGLVGLKPTYGLVSRYGIIAYASSLDQVGPFGKSAEDVAIMLQAIAGFDPQDSTSLKVTETDYRALIGSDIKGIKIGLPKQLFGPGFDEKVKIAVLSAIAELSALGAEIKEVSLPHLEYALASYYLIACAEASSNLQRYDGVRFGYRAKEARNVNEMIEKSRSYGFGPEVKRRILLGTYILSAGYYDAYYLQAKKARELIRRDFIEAFSDVDLLAGPVSPVPPFKLGEKTADPLTMYLTDVATVSVNLAGIPALSVPCGTVNGLPVGLQLMGGYFKEPLLLGVAHALETRRTGEKSPWEIQGVPLGSLVNLENVPRLSLPIERIARLARLHLTDKEKELFSTDLGSILGYVELLGKADAAHIIPVHHPVASHQQLRPDIAKRFASTSGTTKNAAETENNAFKIPAVLEEN